MKLPKLATTVMLESIVVAQTITLVPIVQLDTKTMLQKVDHVCPVFLVNFKMKMARHRAKNVQGIPKVKTRLRSVVGRVVLAKNRMPAVQNVQNAMRVKPGWVLMVRVTYVPGVNTVPVIWMLPVAVRVRMVSVKVIRGKLRASNVVPANSTMFRVLFVVNYV